MVMTQEQATWFGDTFDHLVSNIGLAVLGKSHVVRLSLTCLLGEGHLLLEDAPGTGKTSLARSIAATVHGTHQRIQFTPDLLPSDVTGVTIYDPSNGQFEFHQGPVFASIVLADEINRASPKTQSALLQVMEESQVTVDRDTHEVGRPFMVIATQNPIEQAGTYRLPEAQLDRFLMKTSIGFPDHATYVTILAGASIRDRSAALEAVITVKGVNEMANLASEVYVDGAILDYISRLVDETRTNVQTRLGVSVRGALGIVRAAKVWAAMNRRYYVIPDDIKDLVSPVWAHRIIMDPEAEFTGATAEGVISKAMADVAPPLDRQGGA